MFRWATVFTENYLKLEDASYQVGEEERAQILQTFVLKALEEKTAGLHQHDACPYACLFTGMFKGIADALKPVGEKNPNQTA